MAEEVNVKLLDGSVVLAEPYKGGWMGGTPQRPYPDFQEVTGEPMGNGIQPDGERITREAMYFGICHVLRKRSTCLRGKVGAIIIRNKRIVAMGYNGSPPNMPHCFDLGCDLQENAHVMGCQRAIHAERNAIAFAAREGISTEETEMWCTHGPCRGCAQLIVAAGITALHYQTPYRMPEGLALLDQANVPTFHHASV